MYINPTTKKNTGEMLLQTKSNRDLMKTKYISQTKGNNEVINGQQLNRMTTDYNSGKLGHNGLNQKHDGT